MSTQEAVEQRTPSYEEQAQLDLMTALPMLDCISRNEYRVTLARPDEDAGEWTGYVEVSFYNMNRTDPKALDSYLGFWKLRRPGKPDTILEANPVGGTHFSMQRSEMVDGKRQNVDVLPEEMADYAATLSYVATHLDYETEFRKGQEALKATARRRQNGPGYVRSMLRRILSGDN